jgi:hypothetical protein
MRINDTRPKAWVWPDSMNPETLSVSIVEEGVSQKPHVIPMIDYCYFGQWCKINGVEHRLVSDAEMRSISERNQARLRENNRRDGIAEP